MTLRKMYYTMKRKLVPAPKKKMRAGATDLSAAVSTVYLFMFPLHHAFLKRRMTEIKGSRRPTIMLLWSVKAACRLKKTC